MLLNNEEYKIAIDIRRSVVTRAYFGIIIILKKLIEKKIIINGIYINGRRQVDDILILAELIKELYKS